ncbi:MAG: hypothetical protein KAJ96_04655, partial [Candidatus Thorarchaeota archaeon]|nr:hypothetical protein [Candidatus Thorarchaeota archaeon]
FTMAQDLGHLSRVSFVSLLHCLTRNIESPYLSPTSKLAYRLYVQTAWKMLVLVNCSKQSRTD